MMKQLSKIASATLLGLLNIPLYAHPVRLKTRPTVVLVHGAFAESSSWNGVISRLRKDHYSVVTAANPLRSVKGDAAFVSALVESILGPVVLVGHSYAGTVISAVSNRHKNVKALVFVDAFAPEAGESSAGLSTLYPGSSLGPALTPPIALPGGSHDLYIDKNKYRAQFAADVPASQVLLMAATQRPITAEALNERSGPASWKSIPNWSIYGNADLNIPPKTLAFMAKRAKSRHTVVVKGGSHVVMVSHPLQVAALIEEAASAK